MHDKYISKMFQGILQDYSMPTFEIGIGLGCSEDLVIKAGKKVPVSMISSD